MSWMMAGMAAMGVVNAQMAAKAKAKENQKNAEISAAETQYSPWTGIQPTKFQYQDPNATGNSIAQGAQGALSGAMFNSANKAPPAQTPGAAQAAPTSPYSSMGSAEEANNAAVFGQQPGAPQVGGQNPWMGMKSKNPFLYGDRGGV